MGDARREAGRRDEPRAALITKCAGLPLGRKPRLHPHGTRRPKPWTRRVGRWAEPPRGPAPALVQAVSGAVERARAYMDRAGS